MTTITRVEIHEFAFDAKNLGLMSGARSVGAVTFAKGETTRIPKFAVRIETEDGCRGEYVTNWVASASTLGQTKMLAPKLIGQQAEQREALYDALKWEARQFDHMGHGAIDIALWDWQGRQLDCSISVLLGGYRTRLPAYASTYLGDRNGGLGQQGSLRRLCRAVLRAWVIARTKFTAGATAIRARKRRTCCMSRKPSATA